MRLLDRYVIRLMVLPILIGLAVFVVIMLSEVAINLGRSLLGMRVPPDLIGLYFLYRTPRAIAWSLPVGLLVGAAMTCTQLERSGEATAIRAAGVSLQRIWLPMIGLSVLGAGASLAIEELLVPAANERASDIFRQMTHSQPIMHSYQDQAFLDKQGRLIFVGSMNPDDNTLSNVMVIEHYPDGTLRTLTCAMVGTRLGDTWVLRDGTVISFDREGHDTGQWERFSTRKIELWAALQDFYLDQRQFHEYSAVEMREKIGTLRTAGQDPTKWQVRLQFRYSMPLACVVFVLVAAPLGTRFARLGSFAGIVVSIVVVFLYNGVRSWGLAFGLVGELDPVVAAWAQNVIFGALGLWLTLSKN